MASLVRYDNLNLVGLVKAGRPFPLGFIEPATGGYLQLDAISPVLSGGALAGFVLYSIDLGSLLARVSPAGGGLQHSIFYDNRRVATTLDGSLRGQGLPSGLASLDGTPTQFGIYDLGAHIYAGAYGPATQNSRAVLAADVDDSVFAAQRVNDALVVVFTTTLLATILSLVAIFFARRFALRPLAELGRGAAGSGPATTPPTSMSGRGMSSAAWPSASTRCQSASRTTPVSWRPGGPAWMQPSPASERCREP